MSIGNNIKHYRKQLGLTQTQLGEHIGVTYRMIQKYEAPENTKYNVVPSIAVLRKLAEALHVSVSDFLAEEEKEASIATKNILFLDFDGVVNIPWWSFEKEKGWDCSYNHPGDGTVNNVQAVQWVSEFCQKYNYAIVVTSTWRMNGFDYKKCLYRSGLRKDIPVIGATPVFHTERGLEISSWLKDNPQYTNYLIFDDEADMGEHLDRLVQTKSSCGFTEDHYNHAVSLHKAFNSNI